MCTKMQHEEENIKVDLVFEDLSKCDFKSFMKNNWREIREVECV